MRADIEAHTCNPSMRDRDRIIRNSSPARVIWETVSTLLFKNKRKEGWTERKKGWKKRRKERKVPSTQFL